MDAKFDPYDGFDPIGRQGVSRLYWDLTTQTWKEQAIVAPSASSDDATAQALAQAKEKLATAQADLEKAKAETKAAKDDLNETIAELTSANNSIKEKDAEVEKLKKELEEAKKGGSTLTPCEVIKDKLKPVYKLGGALAYYAVDPSDCADLGLVTVTDLAGTEVHAAPTA